MMRLVLHLIPIPLVLVAALASPALAQSDKALSSETCTLDNGVVATVIFKRSTDTPLRGDAVTDGKVG